MAALSALFRKDGGSVTTQARSCIENVFRGRCIFGYWDLMDQYFGACPVNIAATFSLKYYPEQ